ncbi:MAG: pseudouridine synthase [Treponemataceae bacterium]
MQAEKIQELNLKSYDRAEILFENSDFAIVYKPANMPTAPLRENEAGTLLAFFLEKRPQAKSVRSAKKIIEHGLLHRLDTATSGLVLIAKTQNAYDALFNIQEKNLLYKNYFAFCSVAKNHAKLNTLQTPFEIATKFRPYGVGGKKVKPVLLNSKEAKRTKGRVYTSTIISLSKPEIVCQNNSCVSAKVQLSKGYRHQVRSHLSFLGLPIFGDALYNPNPKLSRLQLFAVEIILPENIFTRSGATIGFRIMNQVSL